MDEQVNRLVDKAWSTLSPPCFNHRVLTPHPSQSPVAAPLAAPPNRRGRHTRLRQDDAGGAGGAAAQRPARRALPGPRADLPHRGLRAHGRLPPDARAAVGDAGRGDRPRAPRRGLHLRRRELPRAGGGAARAGRPRDR